VQFSDFDPIISLQAVLPELLLLVLILVVLGLDLVLPESRKRGLGVLAGVGQIAILIAMLVFSMPSAEGVSLWGGMFQHDLFTLVFRGMFLFAGAATCLISLDVRGVNRQGEYYAIILAAVLGMNLMAAANDLIMVYVALETTSIALYLLAGYLRDDIRSSEAGMKYFLFGSVSAAVMLFGLSLLYGMTGRTGLREVAAALVTVEDTMPIIGAAVMVAVGFGFKIAAAPFHFWTPDVYEGAPTPITTFVSVASKAAGFAVLLRVFTAVFPTISGQWVPLMAAISAVTMTIGNVLAIPQRNIKRMLAYSSIAQAGYVLIGFVAGGEFGLASATYYLLTYVLTNIAAFTVVILFANRTGSEEIYDYAGLSRRSPYLAFAMLLALLSLGGIPPLAGFLAKINVFAAAINAGLVWLAVVGVINAIIGLYYYLTVAKVIYVRRSEQEHIPIPVPRAYAVVLAVMIVGIIALAVGANPWLNWAVLAARPFFVAGGAGGG
jgi:NADH-quinone oxidoreductase subunit N